MPFLYHTTISVHGILWYHYTAKPSYGYYVHRPSHVFHNYGLELAILGYIVDPSMGYVSIKDITNYRKVADFYREHGIYVYPAVVRKAVLKEIHMSAIGEGFIELKAQSRLAYPDRTRNIVLAPGSELETFILSERKLPSKIITRLGSKRAGVVSIHLRPVRYEVIEGGQVNTVYNIADSPKVVDPVIVLTHPAGDIGMFGKALGRVAVVRFKAGKDVREYRLPLI